MKKTCSWWLISYLEETCATICSRTSTLMKELLNCTSVSWHFPWIICRDTTSFTGERISFEGWAAFFSQTRGIWSHIRLYGSVYSETVHPFEKFLSLLYRCVLGQNLALKRYFKCFLSAPFSSSISIRHFHVLVFISYCDVHFLNTKYNT